MTAQLFAITPRRIDFRTQANADWLDGLVVWQAGAGGIVAGTANVGNGTVTINAVAPQTPLGHYVVTVTSLGPLPRVTVQDPDENVAASGVAGLPIYASGLSLTVQAGSTAFSVGDTFAVEVLQVGADITGLRFDMQARQTQTSASVSLSATSAPTNGSYPTILVGTTGGQVAVRLLKPAMKSLKSGTYVYDILATDPQTGLTVPAFFGTIEHLDGVTLLP